MAKFQFALVLLFVAFAVLGCEAQRQRARPIRLIQRNRKLARQEAEEPVTPYPSADELKPEVPFEEAFPVDGPADVPAAGPAGVPSGVPAGVPAVGDEVVPGTTELTPEEVYGAPDVAVVYTPDEVYGPPEFDALPANAAFARQRAQRAQKARLVKARRQAAYRQAKLAKLRAVKKNKA